MKIVKISIAWVSSLILLLGGVAVSGCATARHNDTVSMLSAAGFRSKSPMSAQQQVNVAALPPYELQRQDLNGRVIFAFKDERAGVVYMGDESNYQRYQELAFQQRIANQQLAAAQLNQSAAMNWGFWGTPGYWGYWSPPGYWR